MRQKNRYLDDMLDIDEPAAAGDVIWRAGKPSKVHKDGCAVIINVPFRAQTVQPVQGLKADQAVAPRQHEIQIRAYGNSVLRVTAAFGGTLPDDESVMLRWYKSLKPEPLDVNRTQTGWSISDSHGTTRMVVDTSEPPIHHWSDLVSGPEETFNAAVWPDGKTQIGFTAYDEVGSMMTGSLPVAYVERAGVVIRSAFRWRHCMMRNSPGQVNVLPV